MRLHAGRPADAVVLWATALLLQAELYFSSFPVSVSVSVARFASNLLGCLSLCHALPPHLVEWTCVTCELTSNLEYFYFLVLKKILLVLKQRLMYYNQGNIVLSCSLISPFQSFSFFSFVRTTLQTKIFSSIAPGSRGCLINCPPISY